MLGQTHKSAPTLVTVAGLSLICTRLPWEGRGNIVRTKTEPKKLSKAALWWKKHPNGLDVIIHDMRAVMR